MNCGEAWHGSTLAGAAGGARPLLGDQAAAWRSAHFPPP